MEISDFPWLPLEFSESTVFSILALHIVSRMHSHVFLVADLIDPYLSPRCITQNMALARFFLSALCHAHLDDNGRYRLDRIHCVWCTTIRPSPSSRTSRLPVLSFRLPRVPDVWLPTNDIRDMHTVSTLRCVTM